MAVSFRSIELSANLGQIGAYNEPRRLAWPCAAPGGCRSDSSRARARDAKRDQDQPIDTPRFWFRKTGNNRTEQADRQRFRASARFQAATTSVATPPDM